MEARQLRLIGGVEAGESRAGLPAASRQFSLFPADENQEDCTSTSACGADESCTATGANSPSGGSSQAAHIAGSMASVHGTIHPMYAPGEVDWAAIAAGEQTRVEVPEDQREQFALATTIRSFYEHPVYGLAAIRRQAVKDDTLAQASLVKDAQAINRWERFSPRPGSWPAGRPWQGRPLGAITDVHVSETLAAMRAVLAAETCRSTWNHLRTIFHRAVEVKALADVPEVSWGKHAGDREAKQVYGDRHLVEIYEALSGQADLQTAFVVSVNVGPRTVDLFCLRWEDFALDRERPVVEYTARKTGKLHVVPLAAVTVSHLLRWRRASGMLPLDCGAGYVFPDLSDASAAEPEQSRAARRRNARFKRVLASLKIEVAKPWQVGRLTCNERLERHRPGAGQFVLGHANTLNSVSYREPSSLVHEAVTTLPQPSCFLRHSGEC